MLMVVCLCRNEGECGPGTEETLLESSGMESNCVSIHSGVHMRSGNCLDWTVSDWMEHALNGVLIAGDRCGESELRWL